MRILTRITASSGLDVSSAGTDTITLGNSSVDKILANAPLTASNGINTTVISASTLFVDNPLITFNTAQFQSLVVLNDSSLSGSTNVTGNLNVTNALTASLFTGSYLGSGLGLYNLTASGISNFTNDVRDQFSAGSNIGISSGIISLSSSVSTTAVSGTTGVSGALGLFTNLTASSLSSSNITGPLVGTLNGVSVINAGTNLTAATVLSVRTLNLTSSITSGLTTISGTTNISSTNGNFTNLTGSALTLSGLRIDDAWTSYNVSWVAASTNPVLGNGTLTGYYKQIGKTVFVRVKLVCGSTTTFGSGDWQFSLPVSASSAAGIQFPCSMLDTGNAWYQGIVNGEYSGYTDRSSIIGQSANSNSSQGITATFPITWGDGDKLQFAGSYEAA